MTLITLLSLLAAMAVGSVVAVLLTRSRIALARAEASSGIAAELAVARAQIDSLKELATSREGVLRSTEGGVTTLRAELEQARLESARVGAQVESERGRAEGLEVRRAALEAAGVAAQQSMAAVQAERAQLQAVLAESQANLTNLIQEREALLASKSTQGEALHGLRDDHLRATNQAATLTAQVASETQRVQELQVRASGLEAQLQEVEAGLAEVQEERAALQASLAESQASLAHLTRERDTLSAEVARKGTLLEQLQGELQIKSETLTALTEQLDAAKQVAEARMEAVQEAQEQLSTTFQALSAEALRANNEAFLQLAGTQLQGVQANSVADLEARRVAIENLIGPVQTNLTTMQEQVQRLAMERAAAEASLGTHIQGLLTAQLGLQGETAKLANALGKPEVRGQWGEKQLLNVVEFAGMTKHVDFETQDQTEVDGQKRRPDMVVKLPGGKRIAVDAKTTARAYLEALAETGEAREKRLRDVAGQVRTQVENLGKKGYYDGMVESPDFVVLFLPLEALFSLALEQDPDLLEFAAQRNVIPASPTTLLALLKAAAYGWDQERVQSNAEEIQTLGGELVKRLSDMVGHVTDLRAGLEGSVKAFNAFAGTLESRVMVSSQKMASLGIQATLTGKGKKGKKKFLHHHAPQAISMDLSGLPKLGIAGPQPVLDAEIIEDDEDGLGSLETEVL